ncbi:hypothetical protein AMECASPLE_020859, partial [Ameca splendens]
ETGKERVKLLWMKTFAGPEKYQSPSSGRIIHGLMRLKWNFLEDDTVSASSNMDMEDRVSHLEQRLQLQEDEIQLLKAALADALRRLGYCEEQTQGTPAGGAHAGRRPLANASSTPPTR